MGLQMTLTKDKNKMYTDFIDAYWAIEDVFYTPETVNFVLRCWPSRESRLMDGQELEDPSIGYGSGDSIVSSHMYIWNVSQNLSSIFPGGIIPIGRDAQYTAIYNWIKDYTQLPFEDVFEEDN